MGPTDPVIPATGGTTSSDPWAPLGAALLAFHRGRSSAVLRVDSDAFATEKVSAAAYYRPDSFDLPALELEALSRCRGHVLDVGAGAGRHALELQARGLEVTALDIDPAAVQIMAERGVRDARRGEIASLEGKMFDTVLLLMNGIGVAGDTSGLDHWLGSLSRMLAPGGQVVCDSADLLTEFGEDDLESLRSAAFGNLMQGEVSFRLRYEDLEGEWYRWLFASPQLLGDHAIRADLSCEVVAHGERGAYLAVLRATVPAP